jgi:tryptophan synthase alpha chain
MSGIDQAFAALRSTKRKAFIPFITAGDPDLDFTAELMKRLAKEGATLIELGIPYSDPIADGPVIQASYTRALDKKIKLAEILAMTKKVAPTLPCPVALMVSYAIIYRHGPEAFIRDAQAAGIAGAIVPDLLVEEAAVMSELCKAHDFSLIQLVTPTTPRERAVRIAKSSTGFLYYVSITGITGERTQLPPDIIENVTWLRGQTDLPLCIGFGISTRDHVKLLGPAADGVIVGSAIVRRVADTANRPRETVLNEIGQYVGELKAAL